jgi:predicted nucleic-acid-binding protein
MVAIDTNVLLRLLLDDHEAQSTAARALQRTSGPSFVSHIVLAELSWVLTASYRFRRAKVADLMEMLLETNDFVVENASVVQSAIVDFRASKADFSDCLILAVARGAGALPLASFDDHLCKLPDTRRLGGRRR